jgi:hypothetical protein
MAKTLYCWRCKADASMLEAHEWQQIAPFLRDALAEIKDRRVTQRISPADAKARGYGTQALERYFQLTGFRETNVDALWHHRLALFGPPCRTCGKPLRTPRAKLCAECGATVSE